MINDQTRYLKYRGIIDSLHENSFLSIKPDVNAYSQNLLEETDMQALGETQESIAYSTASKRIFCDQTAENRVVFSNYFGDSINPETDICYLNDSSFIVSNQLRKMLDPKADFSFMYPANSMSESDAEIEAEELIEAVFGLEMKNVQCHLIPYNFKADVLFLDTNKPYGFEISTSPVVLYCNTASTRLQEEIRLSDEIDNTHFSNTVFQMDTSEAEQMKEKYHLVECQMTNTSEQFDSLRNGMLHIVIMNTVISVLMIILNLSIGSTIIRLQYIINAKRLSVMKILGYSIVQMNASILLLNLFSVIIGLITNLILAAMYHKTNWWLIMLVSVFFILADTFIALLHIQKLERTNTPKILKGGSL